ncbi:MAG: tyrosine-type recombinase/integrase [Rhodobacteraceae bacterium]|nr:tyrosine-type recombinase/integrase [Paracoccaceae bacterium]
MKHEKETLTEADPFTMVTQAPPAPVEVIEVFDNTPVGLLNSKIKQAHTTWRLFFSGRPIGTRRSYTQDFFALGKWMGFAGTGRGERAGLLLLSLNVADAYEKVHAYRSHMIDLGLAASTINHRLATIRSFTKLAKKILAVEWELEIRGVPQKALRDVKGPGTDVYKQMLAVATSPRDTLILRLLFDVALRRAEVVSLDCRSVFARDGRVYITVRTKGNTDMDTIRLPQATEAAVRALVESERLKSGPLIRNYRGGRLSGTSVYRVIAKIADAAGVEVPVSPHRLRHSGITRAAKVSGGDMIAVQAFSRHAQMSMAAHYVDAQEDLGGTTADKVGTFEVDEVLPEEKINATPPPRGSLQVKYTEPTEADLFGGLE